MIALPHMFWFFAIPFVVLLAIVLLIPKKKAISKSAPIKPTIFDNFSPNGKIWIKELYDTYAKGGTWPYPTPDDMKVYEERFGKSIHTQDAAQSINNYYKELGIAANYLELPDNHVEYKKGDFFFWLQMYLNMRYQNTYEKLRPYTHKPVIERIKHILYKDEVIYDVEYNTNWFNQRPALGPFRYSVKAYNPSDLPDFFTDQLPKLTVRDDFYFPPSNGLVAITDSRILFKSETGLYYTSIALADISGFHIFKDAISFTLKDGEQPIIGFPVSIRHWLAVDSINPFLRVLYRVLSQTENLDFKEIS